MVVPALRSEPHKPSRVTWVPESRTRPAVRFGSRGASTAHSDPFRDFRATDVHKDCRIRPLRILRNERYPVTARYYYDYHSGEHRGIEVGKINYRVKCISKPRSD